MMDTKTDTETTGRMTGRVRLDGGYFESKNTKPTKAAIKPKINAPSTTVKRDRDFECGARVISETPLFSCAT